MVCSGTYEGWFVHNPCLVIRAHTEASLLLFSKRNGGCLQELPWKINSLLRKRPDGKAVCVPSRYEFLHADCATSTEKPLLPMCLQLCHPAGQTGHAGILSSCKSFCNVPEVGTSRNVHINQRALNPLLSLPVTLHEEQHF